MIAALLATFLLTTPTLGDENDLLVFADGKQQACRVLLETENKVVYRVGNKTSEVSRVALENIVSVERSLSAFLKRFASVKPGDVPALAELANSAEVNHLPGEARDTWIRILTLDPQNEQAWTRLGGARRDGVWQLRVGGRFYTLEELRTRVSDWQNALELHTAHFLIRTDGSPERALDLAIDVERAYLTFYDVFGQPLELYTFDEVPAIHLFNDPKDFRSPPKPGQPAWFERGSNVLNVNGQQASERGPIVAEFSEALIFNAFRRTLAKTGELEPWARKGLEQAFATAVRPDPGRVVFDFTAPNLAYFQAQASDPKPLSLEQVLRAGFASFDSGKDKDRYAAQAYTLLHFLVFYENSKYRLGLANYLKNSYLGKGGVANFLEALTVDQKTLEAHWTSHVKAIVAG
ncbi:MAG: hypothetical protein EXS08_13455 [Planctomycetes bacterium]|nr:hypothetical protein [Planctomycetota bacterium]